MMCPGAFGTNMEEIRLGKISWGLFKGRSSPDAALDRVAALFRRAMRATWLPYRYTWSGVAGRVGMG